MTELRSFDAYVNNIPQRRLGNQTDTHYKKLLLSDKSFQIE